MCTEIYHRITQTTVRNKLVNGSDKICGYRGKKLGEKKKGPPTSNMVWFYGIKSELDDSITEETNQHFIYDLGTFQ